MDRNELSPIAASATKIRSATASIAEALNRSAQLNVGYPTRTIRITEAEQASRDNTPNPITVEDLVNRPRSNPRTRTPMRYESPLESGAFRNTRQQQQPREPNNNEVSSRINIRPMAGSAVGTTIRRINTGMNEKSACRSMKQGPSQRKIRKWNNEHFAGLAAEIASNDGHVAADVLAKAHRDAHLYRSVLDPNDRRRSVAVDRFMKGDEMKDIRDQFFEGYGPAQKHNVSTRTTKSQDGPITGDEMLHRIDQRLRRLVIRACHNSYAAAKVVELFESYIVGVFTKDESTFLENDWWKDLLLERPTITQRNDSDRHTVQFFFHPTQSTGGFHRLLLHAVCQFHGLNVVSRTEENYEYIWDDQVTTTGARSLSASGRVVDMSNGILLLDHIEEATHEPIGYAVVTNETLLNKVTV